MAMQPPASHYLAPRPYEVNYQPGPGPYQVIYGPASGAYSNAAGRVMFPAAQKSQPPMMYIDKQGPQEPQQPRTSSSTPFSSLGGLFNSAWADLPPRPVRESHF